MSEADKMFEKINFNKALEDDIQIIYVYEDEIYHGYFRSEIYFYKESQMVGFRGFYNFDSSKLNAINQKIKELGWSDFNV